MLALTMCDGGGRLSAAGGGVVLFLCGVGLTALTTQMDDDSGIQPIGILLCLLGLLAWLLACCLANRCVPHLSTRRPPPLSDHGGCVCRQSKAENAGPLGAPPRLTDPLLVGTTISLFLADLHKLTGPQNVRRRRNGVRPRPAVKAFWRLHNNNNKWILHNTRNPFASAWSPKPIASALGDVLLRNFFASHCSRHQIVIAPGPTNRRKPG